MIRFLMDFSADYSDSTFDPAEYIVTAKLKVHKEASLLDKNSITASGRVEFFIVQSFH